VIAPKHEHKRFFSQCRSPTPTLHSQKLGGDYQHEPTHTPAVLLREYVLLQSSSITQPCARG
jgi:hypothetical protein